MSHYFVNDELLESNIKLVNTLINGKPFKFYTDNGVFSKKGLDYGTRTLLESLDNISGSVLDFGCGYGAIGIYVTKIFNTETDMIDVNKRSLSLARKNANENGVVVDIFESDIYSNITKKYNYIITNPPIRVGKKVLYEILFGAKDHLLPNGEMWLVINKNQGAKSLIKDLEKEYKVSIKNKSKGFYIICCTSN